jgi:hypothetical protein
MNAVMASVQAQPDGVLYPKHAVLQLLQQALVPEPPGQAITPGRAARELGWSKSQWTRWFRDGRVEGAFRDEAGRWRASRAACISLIESLKDTSTTNGRSVLRGPRKARPETGRPAIGAQG